ncbi:MAG: glycosyltransferase family 2 protein [Gemmatimonadetes bacterium]|nr:glycosyltransferase family 2 protein [Gemmatimonadota bacterium]
MELSIVMPCLNEAETVATCVGKARAFLERHGIAGEVLVADNGSTDGSQALAERAGARVVPVTEKGYGAALMGGIGAARGRFVAMGDADDSYDFLGLLPFVERLRAGDDLVMGNRFAGGIAQGAMPPLHRYLGNPVLTAIGRLFFRAPVRDFHCGLRAFRRDAILALDLRTTGMEFASEMVVRSVLAGLRVSEVPTTLRPDGRSRAPHLRSWRDGWRHLRFLLLYSPRYLFLLPGTVLAVAGLAVIAWLLPGPRVVAGVGFDVHTMLFAAAAVLLGAQSLFFAVFTKTFASESGLVPRDARVDRLYRYVSLETGLVVSGVVLLAGLALAVASVTSWARTGYGAMDVGRTMRLVIPAMLLMVLGAQGMLASFFLSVLGLRRR